MNLLIAEKLKPFDHTPGIKVLLPGSTLSFQIFPTLIIVEDMSFPKPKEQARLFLNIEGPVKDFTVQLNLEKGNVTVFGHSKVGYFRYSIQAFNQSERGFLIKIERNNENKISLSIESQEFNIFSETEKFFITKKDLAHEKGDEEQLFNLMGVERLSFGNHKAQDWNFILRRGDLKEIFPIWLRLGQLVESQVQALENKKEQNERIGTCKLMKECQELFEKRELEALMARFFTLFQVAFHGMMIPSHFDLHHLGVLPPISFAEREVKSSPLFLLSEGAKLIRSLFFSSDVKSLNILTSLPACFHEGRFLHLRAEKIGIVDLEWSKKMIRRMVLIGQVDREIEIKWQKGVKRFRFKEEGSKTALVVEVGSKIRIEKSKRYYFDRFDK